jgi:hypothetical protein
VNRILGGEVLPNDRTYLIKFWMYEVGTEDLATAQGSCEDCDEASLAEAVASTAGRLLSRAVPGRPAPVLEETAVPPAPAPAPAQVLTPRPSGGEIALHAVPQPMPWQRRGRQVLAGVLGGVFAASLTTAIVMTAKDGEHYGPCQDQQGQKRTCAYDFSWSYPIGYALAAASFGGSILALTLPERRARTKEAR